MRDILKGEDTGIAAVEALLTARAPDAVLLTGFDWDLNEVALSALAERLRSAGLDYPHSYAPRPNSGFATAFDLDGDGRLGGPGDAEGWGAFTGKGGLALLARWPLDQAAALDFTDLLWRDLPGAELPTHPDGTPFPSAEAQASQRLSSTGHWAIPMRVPEGSNLWLTGFAAAPPLFDGPERRNQLRNRDELRFWALWLDGALDAPAPEAPVVIMGKANVDPRRGAGDKAALNTLRSHPWLQDPAPADSSTARFRAPPDGPGPLRINYVLPDQRLSIIDHGVDWHPDLRHGLVWVTVHLPG